MIVVQDGSKIETIQFSEGVVQGYRKFKNSEIKPDTKTLVSQTLKNGSPTLLKAAVVTGTSVF